MAFDEISMAIWYGFFALSVGFSGIMVWKSMGEGLTRSQREYYIGVGIFVIVHLIARIFYFIFDFYGNNPDFWDLGAIIGIAGILVWVYAIERHVFTRSYFIFTIVVAIAVVLLIVLPDEMKPTVQTIVVPTVGSFIPLMYLYVAYKGTGNIRKYSLMIFLGIMVFLAGQTAHMKILLTGNPFIYFILSPILMSIGGLIFLYGLIHT